MSDPTSALARLAQSAFRIRRYAVRMGEVQGQGYIGQALGWADVLAVAYRHALNLRPAEPEWEGRDRFLLSHGHYAIAHYAALIEAGLAYVDEQSADALAVACEVDDRARSSCNFVNHCALAACDGVIADNFRSKVQGTVQILSERWPEPELARIMVC